MDERAGAWILGDLLARGDLAEVRAATDGTRAAVVKRLHAHTARDPALRSLFAAEAALTCALPPHPHLVRGLDAVVDGERPALAMAPIAGHELRDRLGAPMARTELAAIVAAAASAAAHLHAHGWVHGDLGPANVRVGATAVVFDLGVARALGAPGPVRGTAAYMAPEQVRGEPWTAAVDVFALGVIAWELASGRRLFHRGASYLTMAAIVETAAPPLADPDLAPIVARALARDPTARPAAAELAAALAALAPADPGPPAR